MPTYDYKCTSCKDTFSTQHSMNSQLTLCTKCNKDTLQKIIGVASFHFKGEGWASKDIRSNSTR